MRQDREIKEKEHPDQGKRSTERVVETVCLVVPLACKFS